MPTPYTFTELDASLLPSAARAKIRDIVPPPRRYLGYKASPVIVLHDGTEVSLLEVLARVHYPSTNWETHEPIWTDTNWHNCVPSNISIIEKKSTALKRAGRPSRHNIGVPVGHPEYSRRYYAANREARAAYQKARYQRKKLEAVVALDQAGEIKPAGMEPEPVIVDVREEEMATRLLGLLPQLAPDAQPTSHKPTKPHPVFATWGDIQKQRAEPFPDYDLEDITGGTR